MKKGNLQKKLVNYRFNKEKHKDVSKTFINRSIGILLTIITLVFSCSPVFGASGSIFLTGTPSFPVGGETVATSVTLSGTAFVSSDDTPTGETVGIPECAPYSGNGLGRRFPAYGAVYAQVRSSFNGGPESLAAPIDELLTSVPWSVTVNTAGLTPGQLNVMTVDVRDIYSVQCYSDVYGWNTNPILIDSGVNIASTGYSFRYCPTPEACPCDDADGDGYFRFGAIGCISGNDCEPNNAYIHPGATELCDNVNNDCNVGTSDGSGELWFGLSCDGPDSDNCHESQQTCIDGNRICPDSDNNPIDPLVCIDNELNVSLAGDGIGSVDVSPSGDSCGAGCYIYADSTPVVLTATTNDPDYAFDYWSGAGCGTNPVCAFTVSSPLNVIAYFKAIEDSPHTIAAYDHTALISADGILRTWGRNQYGQLGDGGTSNKNLPEPIGSNAWQSIAAGDYHTLAIDSSGNLYAWGYNAFGQLGINSTTDQLEPALVESIHDTWKDVAAGSYHSVALKSDGTVWTWGYNYSGQIGNGTRFTPRLQPVQVGIGYTWKAVAAGGNHTIAIRNDDTLWTWGNNLHGALGDGTFILRLTPVQVGADSWKAVWGGNYHTVALKNDGTLWAWGLNNHGQVGDGSTINRNTPVQVGMDNTWKMASAGASHTIAIKNSGTLWAWGYGTYGQLGLGTWENNRPTPVQVGTNTAWAEVAAGSFHSIGLQSDGSLWAWGYNGYGQLGDGTTNFNSLSPILILP
ncbi:MAG: hypothetical protein OEV42_10585 [Deltaproteobacteria bacterium]|nr:hypothetical protein [Deltaproteobacteria bacterium]